MSRDYFHTVIARGKPYHYFRPPRWMRDEGAKNIRLPGDEAAARAMIPEILQQCIERKMTPEHVRGRTYEFREHVARITAAAKERAKHKGVPCTMTKADVLEMMARQHLRCAVSGKLFTLESTGAAYRRPYAPSIDRVDNARGYELDNCRLVCSIANYAMGEWGEDALVDLANSIIRWRKLRGKVDSTGQQPGKPQETSQKLDPTIT